MEHPFLLPENHEARRAFFTATPTARRRNSIRQDQRKGRETPNRRFNHAGIVISYGITTSIRLQHGTMPS